MFLVLHFRQNMVLGVVVVVVVFLFLFFGGATAFDFIQGVPPPIRSCHQTRKFSSYWCRTLSARGPVTHDT